MKWNFNGYMPTIFKPGPPSPPTSGSNTQKDTGTRICRTCLVRIVGSYKGIEEWKYCPYCGAKLKKEKIENE